MKDLVHQPGQGSRINANQDEQRDDVEVSQVVNKACVTAQGPFYNQNMLDNFGLVFPIKLHRILNDGFESIISWTPSGRCFHIHRPDELVHKVLPRWFRQSKLSSFQRQLNLYGFRRLSRRRGKGSYRHEYFVRDRPELAQFMVRYTPPRPSSDPNRCLKQLNVPFPLQLHTLLNECQEKGMSSIVSWVHHGCGFSIHKPSDFLRHILPRFFRRPVLSSFQRQLNEFGFTRLMHGPDEGSYYHEYFVRGEPALVFRMEQTIALTRQLNASSCAQCTVKQAGCAASIESRKPSEQVTTEVDKQFPKEGSTIVALLQKPATEEKGGNVSNQLVLEGRDSPLDYVVDTVFFGTDILDRDMLHDFCANWTQEPWL